MSEGLLTDELAAAGRRAMVPDTELLGARCGQATATVGPEVLTLAVASAACELPESLRVAPRVDPTGAWATTRHASLPSPKTRSVPAVSVVTLGDTEPEPAAEASTGAVELTPENAIVTIDTWVGGLTTACGFVWPACTTVVHATRRVPSLLVVSKTLVQPCLQLIVVNE